jgi:hypothetical protein
MMIASQRINLKKKSVEFDILKNCHTEMALFSVESKRMTHRWRHKQTKEIERNPELIKDSFSCFIPTRIRRPIWAHTIQTMASYHEGYLIKTVKLPRQNVYQSMKKLRRAAATTNFQQFPVPLLLPPLLLLLCVIS